ncbi:hypothetical protein L249_3764 [Ophiocordyceps polyrhachis-furcata BCC 54312]|uniref:Uncharacterized protein n=1 Tax=Ophiocordyceps polyrhachis-furcata BCC 54312 TaxID=1330021 RepID=A0A367L4J8_9HYPO|nr:hypothetical protein L249_3764 [Ophiocordyceps polyrhachis-furcata BCC 54312]
MLIILPSRWENPPSFIDNFSGIKTCTCQSDRSDRSDPITPAMTAMTRPLWPLAVLRGYMFQV